MRCYYCGCKMVKGGATDHPPNTLSRDHLVPKMRGGITEPQNLVLCCRSCNGDKNALTLDEYRIVQAHRRGLVSIGRDVLKFFGEQASA